MFGPARQRQRQLFLSNEAIVYFSLAAARRAVPHAAVKFNKAEGYTLMAENTYNRRLQFPEELF